MNVEQRVQVRILGAARPYSYAWWFNPLAGEKPLLVGDKVELPVNEVSPEGSSGEVIAVGTSYTGELKNIVRRIETAPVAAWGRLAGHEKGDVLGAEKGYRESEADDTWAGFGQGDYA